MDQILKANIPDSKLTESQGLKNRWGNTVVELFEDVNHLLEQEDPHFTDALNLVSLCWFRQQMGLTRGIDHLFGPPMEMGGDRHFEWYKEKFLKNCNSFQPKNLATYLDFTPATDLLLVDPELISARVLEKLPQAAIELDLVQRTGRHLFDILTGKMPLLEAISPNNNTTMLEAFYYGSGSTSLGNALFSGVFEMVAQSRGRKIKVLEIGAGTGGATASISHLINQHCSDYWFTDVSQIFLSTASRRFPRLNLSYHILDANSPDAFANIADEQFDLVIGANSVHAATHLRQSLGYINRILKPGGVIALMESNRVPDWVEFIFGATPEWWSAADQTDRSIGPLSSVSQWNEMLQEQIGPSFQCVSREFLPSLDHLYFDYLPQIHLATKAVELPPLLTIMSGDEKPEDRWIEKSAATAAIDQTVYVTTELDRHDTVFDFADQPRFISQLCLPIDGNDADYAEIVSGLGKVPRQICLCLSHKAQGHALDENADFDPRLVQQWYSVLAFLRAVVEQRDVAHQITVLTAGCTAAEADDSNMAVAPYKGIFLTIIAEYANALLRYFDLDITAKPVAAWPLVSYLLSRPFASEERIVRGGKLLEPVLKHASLIQPDRSRSSSLFPNLQEAETTGGVSPYEMRMGKLRSFDHIRMLSLQDQQPGAGEVKVDIYFAALNYRDIMKVQGEYPLEGGDYLDLGDECSGIIQQVGEGVDPKLIGQKIMLVGNALLASQRIVPLDQVLLCPENLKMHSAATLPVAYLTAHFSLVNQARIQPGDRVLIHAAAGGVGLAAIKVAKAHGAIVYATASYPKQDIVRYWGADYVYDSRSTDFEEGIMRDTGGTGVDVVLNSLSGEFQAASYRVLRPFGRFVEIGKRDIYEHRSIDQYQLRHNVSVHIVDMGELGKRNPQVWKGLAAEVMQHIKTGAYRTIPFRIYRGAHIGQALRTMASGRHLGKILIAMQDPSIKPVTTANKFRNPLGQRVAFVFGGASGVGLEISRSFARVAISKLVVIGRSPRQSPAVQKMLDEFGGCRIGKVVYEQGDVTDFDQVNAVFDQHYTCAAEDVDVFLASGVYADQPIRTTDYNSFAKVIAPKVMGALNIQRALAGREPFSFCMLSSVSSMLGSVGQCSYSAANAFLDGLATHRALTGLPATSINFGAFADIGHLRGKPDVQAIIERLGVNFVPRYYAMKAMQNATTMGVAQIGFFDFDWQKFMQNIHFENIPEKLRFVINPESLGDDNKENKIDIVKQLAETPADKQLDLLVRYVIECAASILTLEPMMIDPKTDLSTQGLDSLSTVELGLSLQRDMDLDMQATDIGNARDAHSIGKMLLQKYLAAHGGRK